MGLCVSALALEEAMGNLRPPDFTHRAAGSDDDWYTEDVENRCGLRRYPELGIAVQPVSGVMSAGCSQIGEFFGLFNTDRIARACHTVAADAQISTFILAMESPGGYTTGTEEAAAAVETLPSMRKGLTTLAYVSRVCLSAAEWVACACEHIYAAPSAALGSIGVIASITDSSRAWKDQGLDRFVATDGKYKAMGMPGVPVSEDHKAWLVAGVAETSAVYKGYLRARRGISDDAMQGQSFTARKAPAGFCDGTQFSNLEELMAFIAHSKL